MGLEDPFNFPEHSLDHLQTEESIVIYVYLLITNLDNSYYYWTICYKKRMIFIIKLKKKTTNMITVFKYLI